MALLFLFAKKRLCAKIVAQPNNFGCARRIIAEESWRVLWGNNVQIIDSPATVSAKKQQVRMPNRNFSEHFFDVKKRLFFVLRKKRLPSTRAAFFVAETV